MKWLRLLVFRYSLGRNNSIRTPEPLTPEQEAEYEELLKLSGDEFYEKLGCKIKTPTDEGKATE